MDFPVVFYPSTGAGFLPSTVYKGLFHPILQHFLQAIYRVPMSNDPCRGPITPRNLTQRSDGPTGLTDPEKNLRIDHSSSSNLLNGVRWDSVQTSIFDGNNCYMGIFGTCCSECFWYVFNGVNDYSHMKRRIIVTSHCTGWLVGIVMVAYDKPHKYIP